MKVASIIRQKLFFLDPSHSSFAAVDSEMKEAELGVFMEKTCVVRECSRIGKTGLNPAASCSVSGLGVIYLFIYLFIFNDVVIVSDCIVTDCMVTGEW